MRRIEVLDRLQDQARGLGFAPEGLQVLERPKPVRIPGQTPTPVGPERLVTPGARTASAEIVHEMRHNMGRSGLLREGEVFRREHVLVETEAEFHREERSSLKVMNVQPCRRNSARIAGSCSRVSTRHSWNRMTEPSRTSVVARR